MGSFGGVAKIRPGYCRWIVLCMRLDGCDAQLCSFMQGCESASISTPDLQFLSACQPLWDVATNYAPHFISTSSARLSLGSGIVQSGPRSSHTVPHLLLQLESLARPPVCPGQPPTNPPRLEILQLTVWMRLVELYAPRKVIIYRRKVPHASI